MESTDSPAPGTGAGRTLPLNPGRPGKTGKRRTPPALRRVGYVVAIVVNIILIYVANSLLSWHVPFLTESFVVPLQFITLSLAATAAANVLFLLYDAGWFVHLARAAVNLPSIFSTYMLYVVFPFDFGTTSWEPIARIALIGTMIAVVIAIVVELVKAPLGRD